MRRVEVLTETNGSRDRFYHYLDDGVVKGYTRLDNDEVVIAAVDGIHKYPARNVLRVSITNPA